MSENIKAVIHVKLKEGVLDPQGVTIYKALLQMGYNEFESVKTGKFFELEIKAGTENIDNRINEVCQKLLANPVIETFKVEKV